MLQTTGYEARTCGRYGKQVKRQKLKLVEKGTPLRMIPLKAMKRTKIVTVKLIKEYIMKKRKRKGQQIWPSDIAMQLGISMKPVVRAVERLKKEGKLIPAPQHIKGP